MEKELTIRVEQKLDTTAFRPQPHGGLAVFSKDGGN